MSDDEYREFEEALTDVLTETAYSPRRRTRLANARAAVDQHDPRYIEAVDRFFFFFQPRAEADGFTKAPLVQRPRTRPSPLTLTHHATSVPACTVRMRATMTAAPIHQRGASCLWGLGAIIHSY